MNDDEMRNPDRVETLYFRLADTVRTRMEGTKCREYEADIRMFDAMSEDILRNKVDDLSRTERDRLYRLLLSTL